MITQSNFAQKNQGNPTVPLEYFYAEPLKPNIFRMMLSKVRIGISTGFGQTTYKQQINDFLILQQDSKNPFLFDKDELRQNEIINGYTYYFTELKTANNIVYDQNDFLIDNDTVNLSFIAKGIDVPIVVTLSTEIQKKIQFGIGAQFGYHRIGNELSPNRFESQIKPISTNFSTAFYQQYFMIIGGRAYRYGKYSLFVDGRVGSFLLTNKFDSEVLNKSILLNFGLKMEYDLSEHVSVFFRPSYDLKSIELNLPESSNINISMNTWYLNFGLSYRVPELKRCFIKSCATQINHQHGNKKYRSRMHSIFKKQNPHHGENYPQLIRYKKGNRKKDNPY